MPALRSSLPTQSWPAATTGQPALILALLHQLEASQWWTPTQLHAAQFTQLHSLLTHAARHAPAHRRRLRAAGFDPARPLDDATWSRIPILTRADLQARAARFQCTVVPPEHGELVDSASGGSTGIPVRVRGTIAALQIYSAALCREHTWHHFDLPGPLVRIRNAPPILSPAQAVQLASPQGLSQQGHGPPLAWLYDTGPAHLFSYHRPPADQVAVLADLAATTFITLPSNLRLVLTHMQAHGLTLPALRTVRTTSEIVDADLRALCREVLGCSIVDVYSAAEVGLMATQCPDHDHYHVASESCLLEVLDDQNRPCRPGETGRVIVTPLHNFAMPLLRYEVGDRARLGPSCPCGRGLPVLTQIVGRTYDTLLLADGTRQALDAGYNLARIPAITEFQIAQTAPGAVELRIVATRPLTPAEARLATDSIRSRTSPDLSIAIIYRDRLPRTAAGKLRLFISEIPPQ